LQLAGYLTTPFYSSKKTTAALMPNKHTGFTFFLFVTGKGYIAILGGNVPDKHDICLALILQL
jgi:hypothetical protein